MAIDEELYKKMFDEAESRDNLTAKRDALAALYSDLTETTNKYREALEGGVPGLTKFYRDQNLLAMRYNSLASKMQQSIKALDTFNNATRTGKMLYLGQALSTAGQSLTDLRDKIYNLQDKLGTTFSTAVDTGAGALMNMATSLFTAGPALSFQDTIDAFNAYQKEFGTLLTAGAARDIAQGAKQFGTDITTFTKAQRAFLVGPNSVANQAKIQQSFVTQFRAAGLTANQAFAANNANLVAIAGDKYADALARAAANSQRIGVGLNRTEALADSIVGNFEGALERFSELRAMGVEIDFNELARVAGTGTPEEVFDTLSQQLGGNQKLLSELQSNRFLKVALEQDLGLDISEIRRLASGDAGLPAEATKEEKIENGIIAGIMKGLGPLLSGFGFLASAVGINTLASYANTKALLLKTGGSIGSLLPPTSAIGKFGVGAAGVAGLGMSAYGGYQAGKNKSLGGSALSVLGGAASGAMIGSMIPGVGTAIGAVLGGVISLGSALAGYASANDIAMGPGKGRVILGPEGAFKLNAKDSIIAGTNLMGSVGEGAFNAREGYATSVSGAGALAGGFLDAQGASALMKPKEPASGTLTTPQTAIAQQPATTTVNMNTSGIESKLDRLASVFGAIKIEMDGNTVGRVSLNARSPLDRLAVTG